MSSEQVSPLVQLLSSPIIIIFFMWDVIWKATALWKAARHNQLYWFIAIAILNTVGILPIIYIIFFQKDKKK
jgi:hypothetical protein